MASLYPEIQVTKEPNLHATVKVNKEATHIMANLNNFYFYIHVALLKSYPQNCMTYTIAECTVNKLLMMDRGNV
jgi:hypothetical protein